MYKLVLVRHGQSTWNLENRFTGWTDVDLTDLGKAEAREAGKLLREGGYDFDIAYTSVLKRAIKEARGPERPSVADKPRAHRELEELERRKTFPERVKRD